MEKYDPYNPQGTGQPAPAPSSDDIGLMEKLLMFLMDPTSKKKKKKEKKDGIWVAPYSRDSQHDALDQLEDVSYQVPTPTPPPVPYNISPRRRGYYQ